MEATNNYKSYPPHNLIACDDDKFKIEVAVAGFTEEDISVTLEKSVLTIEGKDNSDISADYMYKGIGTRKFDKSFNLAEFIEVVDVTLQNGILTVSLEKNIPEEKKPKQFTINADKSPSLLTE
jgi:molecular chaperone IbpA